MVLRRGQRSIFHLGDEGGAQHVKNMNGSGEGSRNQLGHPRRREQDAAVVGLRILVAHQHHHQHALATPSTRSHIVLKQMVLPPPAAAAARRRRGCGFLRACLLCRRELGPDKDVYMYRGDQGFCSEECRRQQIWRDEARERDDAVTMNRRRGVSIQHHHHHHQVHHHGPRLVAAPRRLPAVA